MTDITILWEQKELNNIFYSNLIVIEQSPYAITKQMCIF